jgi:uncharacterized pyridoxamine 5'-phosphate oxidase family protein
MNKEEIYQLMTSNPVFWLATAEDNKPHCRAMFLYKADENGIVFHTGSMKDIFKQITKNNNVEVCFNDFKTGVQVRVAGKLEEITDNKFKDEICAHPTRQFLRTWRENGALSDFYSQLKVFTLKNGKAVTWTSATNFDPKTEINI